METGEPNFWFYSGESIPLSYRTELDGIEIVIGPDLSEPYVAALTIAAAGGAAPPFVVTPLQPDQGDFSMVRAKDNTVRAFWSQRPEDTNVSLTIRFEESPNELTLSGTIKTAGSFTYFDSL